MRKATRRRLGRLGVMLSVMLIAGLGAGCVPTPPATTVTPIFVTATLEPAIALAPTITATPVIQLATGSNGANSALPTLFFTVTPNPLLAQISTLPTGTATELPPNPPTLTPSFTITFTDSPAPTGIAGVAASGNTACIAAPAGGFNAIYSRDPALQAALGCPVSTAFAIASATQEFENGRMVWVSQFADVPAEVIYALNNNGSYGRYDDTWVEGVDPIAGGESPPAGRTAPIRGFGKVWRDNQAVRGGLGWGTTNEAGTGAQIQRFERGEMIFIGSLNQTLILVGGVNWRADATPF